MLRPPSLENQATAAGAISEQDGLVKEQLRALLLQDDSLKLGTYFEVGPISDFLGGLPDGHDSRLAKQVPYYASLPRPVLLPSKKEVIEDRKVSRAYHRLFGGRFIAGYKMETESRLQLSAGTIDEKVKEDFRGPLINVVVERFERGGRVGSQLGHNAKMYVDEFGAALDELQVKALAVRVLHCFLRAHGYRLPPKILTVAVSQLVDYYQKLKEFSYAVDALMIEADLCVNGGLGTAQIASALTKVGEVLEAASGYRVAAGVYDEVALRVMQNRPASGQCYQFAGLAWKRAGNFPNAERDYVMALHLDSLAGADWNLNTGYTTFLLSNVLLFYDEVAQQPTAAEHKDDQLLATWSAFLYLAGFKAALGGKTQFLLAEAAKRHVAKLRPFLQTPPTAKRALLEATKTPSVDEFRSTLLKCMDPALWTSSPPAACSVKPSPKPAAASAPTSALCGRPGCGINKDKKNMSACPCRAMSYCQKSCQMKHWHAHKQTCVWHSRVQTGVGPKPPPPPPPPSSKHVQKLT